jgi:hypothetical protein
MASIKEGTRSARSHRGKGLSSAVAVLLRAGVLLLMCFNCAYSVQLALTAGAFRFNATDYYYPNFYLDAGYRGEVTYAPSETSPHFLRLQVYGYPGDDNIFETILEYGRTWRIPLGSWEVLARPVGGFAVAKLQYPAPYYPTVEHQYLPWARFGYDASVGRGLVGPLFARAGDRGRVVHYAGSSYAGFRDERTLWQNAPFSEVEWALVPGWKFIGRGGVEVGGYYDDVFLPKEKKLRPFGEVGFAYSF